VEESKRALEKPRGKGKGSRTKEVKKTMGKNLLPASWASNAVLSDGRRKAIISIKLWAENDKRGNRNVPSKDDQEVKSEKKEKKWGEVRDREERRTEVAGRTGGDATGKRDGRKFEAGNSRCVAKRKTSKKMEGRREDYSRAGI